MSNPLVCQLGMAGINFKHWGAELCYRSKSGTKIPNRPIEEIINDPILNEQRLQLLNGIWPSACSDCQHMEEIGVESYRQSIDLFGYNSKVYIDNVDKNSGQIKELHRIEFRFSNRCNFACRHCMPVYSSAWTTLAKKNNIPHLEGLQDEETSFVNTIDLTNLYKFIGEQVEIEFTGGEPFFDIKFYKCLEQLKPIANKVKLVITTNGSIAGNFKNYDVPTILEGFKKVDLKFSLDASKSFYNYFRQGGDWDTVISNVTSLKEKSNCNIFPVVTVSNMQAGRLPEIYNDFEKITDSENFSVCPVLTPSYLDPKHLPTKLKENYMSNITRFKNTLASTTDFDRISEFAVKTMSQERNPKMWKKFCEYTDSLDKIHSKKVFNYFPEYEEYWHE